MRDEKWEMLNEKRKTNFEENWTTLTINNHLLIKQRPQPNHNDRSSNGLITPTVAKTPLTTNITIIIPENLSHNWTNLEKNKFTPPPNSLCRAPPWNNFHDNFLGQKRLPPHAYFRNSDKKPQNRPKESSAERRHRLAMASHLWSPTVMAGWRRKRKTIRVSRNDTAGRVRRLFRL